MVEGLHILSDASGTIWVDSTGLTAEEEQASHISMFSLAGIRGGRPPYSGRGRVSKIGMAIVSI